MILYSSTLGSDGIWKHWRNCPAVRSWKHGGYTVDHIRTNKRASETILIQLDNWNVSEVPLFFLHKGLYSLSKSAMHWLLMYHVSSQIQRPFTNTPGPKNGTKTAGEKWSACRTHGIMISACNQLQLWTRHLIKICSHRSHVYRWEFHSPRHIITAHSYLVSNAQAKKRLIESPKSSTSPMHV